MGPGSSEGGGVEPQVVICIVITAAGKYIVLKGKCKWLGRRLEVQRNPQDSIFRNARRELKTLNVPMKYGCWQERLGFVRHKEAFWDKRDLGKSDDLDQSGTTLLALNVKKIAEQLLKQIAGKGQEELESIQFGKGK